MFQLTWQNPTLWKKSGGDQPIPDPPVASVVERMGGLYWEEHCVECSIPWCYTSCRLYTPRKDGRCARFRYGMTPNPGVNGEYDFGIDVSFRRWAKLQSAWPAAPAMRRVNSVRREAGLIRVFDRACNILANVLEPIAPRRRANGLSTAVCRTWTGRRMSGTAGDDPPDALLLECWSPSDADHRLRVELHTSQPVFQKSVDIRPGWNRHIVPWQELADAANGQPGRIAISVDNDEEIRLVFTWLNLVRFSQPVESETVQPAAGPAEKVKCVAWDLDNTLWTGVIGDAGPDGVEPNVDMLRLVEEFDRRGILQTIVSKNEYEIAWRRIEQLGIADRFLYPAIHWGPKSESLIEIAQRLNINIDTFAVIDDSPFERNEIATALPQVRVFDPAEGESIGDRVELDVPVTPESRTRRLKYLAEAERQRVRETCRGDFDQFLRSCHMVINIRHPSDEDRVRCLELLHRSNQFNLSGVRYSDADFDDLLASPDHECFCFAVSDDFGDYGIVGFAAVENSQPVPMLIDFVLSCRVAKKQVEKTFLLWLSSRLRASGCSCLRASLRVTDRNAPLRQVLDDLAFATIESAGERRLLELVFPDLIGIPDILTIQDSIDPTVEQLSAA